MDQITMLGSLCHIQYHRHHRHRHRHRRIALLASTTQVTTRAVSRAATSPRMPTTPRAAGRARPDAAGAVRAGTRG